MVTWNGMRVLVDRGKPDHLSEENWGEIVAKIERG
jgi:hypothetical protein